MTLFKPTLVILVHKPGCEEEEPTLIPMIEGNVEAARAIGEEEIATRGAGWIYTVFQLSEDGKLFGAVPVKKV